MLWNVCGRVNFSQIGVKKCALSRANRDRPDLFATASKLLSSICLASRCRCVMCGKDCDEATRYLSPISISASGMRVPS
jgi:hypothetical protein